jgi:hypothetical protein
MDINLDNNYWSDLKVKLKTCYPQLTHADFVIRDGAAEEMLIQIANKLVISRKEFNKIIDGL